MIKRKRTMPTSDQLIFKSMAL